MKIRGVLFAFICIGGCDSTGPKDLIPAPDAVLATALTGQITVNWRDVSDRETSYQVEYSTDAVVWTLLKELPANSTSVTHGGVEYQVTYYYRVRACRNTDCSAWVQTSTKWASGIEPSLSKPNVTAVSTHNATISSNAAHGGLQTFVTFYISLEDKIVFQSSSYQIEPTTPGIETGGKFLDVTVFGLSEGTRYIAYVIAKNAAGITTSEAIPFKTSKRGPPSAEFIRFFGPPTYDQTTMTWGIAPVIMVDPGDLATQISSEVVEANKPFSEAVRTSPTPNLITTGVITQIIGTVRGLLPLKTYKWRLVVTNSAGTAVSDSVVFSTPSN